MRALFATLLLLACAIAGAQTLSDTETIFGSTSAGSASDAALFGASNSLEFLPVEQAYQLETELLDENRIRLYWQIADSYYLYQHAFKFKLRDSQGIVTTAPLFPQALERSDEFFGDVKVYYSGADVILESARPLEQGAHLTVTSQGCADAGLCYPPRTEYFELDLATAALNPATRLSAASPPRTTKRPADTGFSALPYMLLLAFLGGAILNLMPCVFPILSLKVLSFARSTDRDRHVHSWVYTGGVVFSFVAVAAVLITLQQAGSAVGWGFQLQSPGFVIALAYLFLAMGLSLSGLVELGSGMMNTGASLADRNGVSGSFFTGVLAVVVASPCTAPFMGTALGFAVTQPPLIGLSVFAALGLGMAAPLVLLGYSTTLRKRMPPPGPWMETLKQLLAFPLYGAAIWLFWVAGRQTGVNTMAAAMAGALMLSLGLWLWRFGNWRRVLAVGCAVAAVSLGAWRDLDAKGNTGNSQQNNTVVWSQQQLDTLRQAGTPVFVDVTADWCITCLANEQAVLFTDEMTAAFKRHGVTYMVADWTNYDPKIARFIATHGRTGIPLYLMYPGDTNSKPLLLPQLLTHKRVVEALEAVSAPVK